MRSEAFRDLLDGLNSLDLASVTQQDKDEFRRLIFQVGAAHGVSLLGPDERVRTARQLLDEGLPRPEVRDRLMSRFHVGDSQAYRDITAALQIVPKPAGFWDYKSA
ncbi:hypothetical protein [Rugamonas rubra]|uniref:hypothetical protein n=1 Tax=Rugamonas rubra TaxID=758825 RepID=UPI001113E427|nr:hypothetical protein [Rugamonas rubra]